MTLEWSILSPIAATNLITNPSAETATTGHTATSTSTTVAASTLCARRGYRSIAVTPASSTGEGEYYAYGTLTSGVSYTFGVDFLGVASVPYSIYFGDTAGTLKGTATSVTGSGYWKRQTVTWACDATATYRIYLVKGASSSTAAYYLDGLQLEATAYATSYMDGDQGDGYTWTGTPHASTSSRAAWCRAGGREYYLDSDIGTRVLLMDGIGMASLDVYSEQRSLLPGAEFQGTRAQPRSLILLLQTGAASVASFHSQRKDLIDLVKPDLVTPEQPFVLRYYGANTNTDALEIRCVYTGGMEFNSPSYYRTDKVALKLTAFDPYWYEAGNASAVLDSNDTSTLYYGAWRSNTTGRWATLGSTTAAATSPTPQILTIKSNPKNLDQVYLGGDFLNLNGSADLDYIALYTISTGALSAVGTDRLNGAVRCLEFDPAGNLYAGGDFTDVGGDTTADYLVRLSSGNWTKLVAGPAASTSVTQRVRCLRYWNQFLFVGGRFDAWGSTSGDNIAYIRAASSTSAIISAMGEGVNDAVHGMEITNDGTVYITGEFAYTGSTSTPLDKFAAYNFLGGTGWSQPTAGDGTYPVTKDLAGDIYACSIFRWNGTQALSLESTDDLGSTGTAKALHWADGGLYAGGDFLQAGADDNAINLAYFNGSSWEHLGITTSETVNAIDASEKGLFVGLSGASAATYGGATTVTNSGTANAYPVIKIYQSTAGSANIQQIVNVTTGARILLNYDLSEGETLTIDLTQTARSVTSDRFGPAWNGVMRASDLAAFYLAPGANTIICYVSLTVSPTIVAWMEFRQPHWSVDGVAA